MAEIAQPQGAQEEKTCFVMMPISDTEGYREGHFSEVYEELIVPAVSEAGYQCKLATSTSSAHLIQLEVITQIATAPLCICDLSTNNPNVLFEYGLRQAFDLPTVLIKDDITRRIFDLSGFRDIEYDHTLRIANITSKRKEIARAISHTVQGAADEKQIFSLVRLMNLTKAALPKGVGVDPEDARYELLERKIDGLASAILGREGASRFLHRHQGSGRIKELYHLRGGQVYIAWDSKLLIVDSAGATIIADPESLYGSTEYVAMPNEEQAVVQRRVREFLPDFF